jgi:hypothetical protein
VGDQTDPGNGPAPAAEEVSLIDESGRERRFRLHDAFDLDDAAYYLVEAVDNPEHVFLLRETPEGLESVHGEEMDRLMARLDEEDAGAPGEEET